MDDFADYELGESSMDCLDRTLPVIDDDDHSLLNDPPLPAYTDVTLRRAFASWLHIGHKTKFRTICDYYHRLEAWEDTLPPKQRAQSRYLEFNLLINRPPTSCYQMQMFPNLYSHSHVQSDRIVNLQAMTNEKCIFKLEGFHNIAVHNTESNKATHSACRAVRKYCKTKSLPLRTFLKDFLESVTKCHLDSDINNLTHYINRKMIESELQTMNNYPKTFSFLERDEEKPVEKTDSAETATSFHEYFNKYETKGNFNKLNKSTAEFFESFNNKQAQTGDNVSCWIFDTYKHITNNDKKKSLSVGNLQNADVSKNLGERWALLKSLMNANGKTNLPSCEEYKV